MLDDPGKMALCGGSKSAVSRCSMMLWASGVTEKSIQWHFVPIWLVFLMMSQVGMSFALDEGEIVALDAMRRSWSGNAMGWHGASSAACELSFKGIECDLQKQHVVSIEIAELPLSGTLPSEIGNFHWIKRFSLLSTPIKGVVPDVYHNWTSIEIFKLHQNSLRGQLPSSICQPSLKHLIMSTNYFTGTLPDCIGELPQLTELSLRQNLLSGTLPASLGTSASLTRLDLAANRFSGPPLPFFASPTIATLLLGENSLSGELPASWGTMSSLRFISLSKNALSGTIPIEWGNLSSLGTLRLDSNLLSGTLPSSLGSLSNLGYLVLSNNMLTGTIPPSLGSLAKVETFDLSNNQLQGELPDELSSLSTHFHLRFNIAYNNISGTIPHWINTLGGLYYLDMSHNSLLGPIPDLASLKSLQRIFLQGNHLEGTFPLLPPSSLLKEINFANNRLFGILPSPAYYNLSKITWEIFNVSNNFFSGPLPSSFSDMQTIKILDVCDNLLNGTITWNWQPQTQLELVGLCGNRFTSPLPQFVDVEGRIDLSRNGELDIQTLDIPWIFPKATQLNLSYSGVFGPLEGVLSTNSLLESVDLTGNQISGPFPWAQVKSNFQSGVLKYLSVMDNPQLLPTSDYHGTGLVPSSGGLFMRSISGHTSCLILSFPSPSVSVFLYDETLVSLSGCRCDKGTWGTPGSCLDCPTSTRGISCPGGPVIEVANNFFPYIVGDNMTGQVASEMCLYDPDWIPANWNPCSSKSLTRSQILSGKQVCASGNGRRCSHCECSTNLNEPCFFQKNMRCVKCSPPILPPPALLGIIIPICLLFCAALVANFTYTLVNSKVRTTGWRLKLKVLLGHGLVKILITFIQFSLELIHWDISLDIGAVGVINSDPTGIGLQCVFRKLASPMISFLLKTLLPFCVIVGAWGLVGISSILSGYIIRRRQRSSDPPLLTDDESRFESDFEDSSLHSHLIGSSAQQNDVDRPMMRLRSARSLGTSITLSVMGLFYFGFSVRVISMLIREKQYGTSIYYMLAHPYLEWNDPTSSLLRVVAGILMIFVIAVPVAKIVILFGYRSQLQDETVFSYISTLYRPFKKNRYWWDLVLTSRKFCIASVLVGIDSESLFKPWAVTITITVFLLIQVYLNPWKRDIENRFDSLASAVLIVTYLSTWYDGDFGDDNSRKLVTAGRIVAIGFVLVLIIVLVVSVLRERLDTSDGMFWNSDSGYSKVLSDPIEASPAHPHVDRNFGLARSSLRMNSISYINHDSTGTSSETEGDDYLSES